MVVLRGMDGKCLKYVETQWATGCADLLVSYWLETRWATRRGDLLVSYWLETRWEMHPAGAQMASIAD